MRNKPHKIKEICSGRETGFSAGITIKQPGSGQKIFSYGEKSICCPADRTDVSVEWYQEQLFKILRGKGGEKETLPRTLSQKKISIPAEKQYLLFSCIY